MQSDADVSYSINQLYRCAFVTMLLKDESVGQSSISQSIVSLSIFNLSSVMKITVRTNISRQCLVGNSPVNCPTYLIKSHVLAA